MGAKNQLGWLNSCDSWMQWRTKLDQLSTKHIPKCYYSEASHISATELHGFYDGSEKAYATVVYLKMKNSDATAQVTLMISKIMVPPLPLRNWGYLTLSFVVLTSLLIFSTMSERCLIYPSTRFTLGQTVQLYVAGTRDISRHLSTIESHTSWSSLDQSTGIMSENRKSCRLCFKGFFPTELLQHYLWWNDPTWLKLESLSWPLWSESPQTEEWHEEEIVLCSVTVEKKNYHSHWSVLELLPFETRNCLGIHIHWKLL